MKRAFLLLALVAFLCATAQSQVTTRSTGKIIGGPTLPATCSPATTQIAADVFIKTGGSAGLYFCSAANTWTQVSGGGGGSPGGSDTQIQRNNAGAFGGVSGATSNGTNITFTSNNLIATSPRFVTTINDTNGNELFDLTATASAVNQFSVVNSATGNNVQLNTNGGDTNIGATFGLKGSSNFQFNAAGTPNTAVSFGTLRHLWTINGNMRMYLTDFSGTTPIRALTDGTAVLQEQVTNGGGGLIQTFTNHILRLSANNRNADDLRISVNGLVSMGTASEIGQLGVVSGSTSRVAARFDSAASPTVNILEATNNGSSTVQFAVKLDGMYTYPGAKILASNFNATTTTYATITGFSVPVRAGRTYILRASLSLSLDNTGGGKIKVNGSATMTAFGAQVVAYDNTTNGVIGAVGGLAFNTDFNEGLTTGSNPKSVNIYGSFTVNAAGTLDLQFAQNSASGTSTVNAFPSQMEVIEVQ